MTKTNKNYNLKCTSCGKNFEANHHSITKCPDCKQKAHSLSREAILKRDKYTCQVCGANGDDVKLQSHPIKSKVKNTQKDFVTLCKACNKGIQTMRNSQKKNKIINPELLIILINECDSRYFEVHNW